MTAFDDGSRYPAWGKTDSDHRPAHHLAHHCMDVAAVFELLLAHPIIRARVDRAAGSSLNDRERTWLATFAFLHDIGKLSPAFQTKAWPEEKQCYSRSHLSEGWRWISMTMGRPDALGGIAHRLLAPLIRAGSPTDGLWLTALFAHHGRPTGPHGSGSFRVLQHYDWRREEAAIGAALHAWFDEGDARPEILRHNPLVHLFAGLLALADWIGSDRDAFPPLLDLDVDGYAEQARKQALAAVRRIGLCEARWPAREPDFRTLTGCAAPREAQAVIGKLPADLPLTIIEAETGSGKTEAALWYFARARSAGTVDALYFAVPTRAAASQLHRRVHEAMSRIGGPEAILAIPGQLRAGEAEGVKLPGYEVRWDDGKSHWAAEHATRFLAAPIAVGTIDQALMGGLQVKHAHLRGAALCRSLLVIDEVHASDPYMNRIARGLVRDHLALGGKALLMSATLGSSERAAWLGRPAPSLPEAQATPYPAIWRSDQALPVEVARDVAIDGTRTHGKRVTPLLVPTMCARTAATLAIRAARAKARVLIVRNTVDAAVRTWRAIVDEDPSLCMMVGDHQALHHSRFAVEDRRRLDEAVEAGFDKGLKPQAGLIAVGTQTLEQSLDIDADLLITDLCPMDVLLQRIGRLHRHDRARPEGFTDPVVHVLCPENGLDRLARENGFENGLGAWQQQGVLNGIYIDLRSIEATRRHVEKDVYWNIPQDNRHLVEAATHADELDRIAREMDWTDHAIKVDAKAIAEEQHGAMLSLDRSKPFPEAFPDADEAVQTRLGSRGVLLDLPEGTVGPFGKTITRIAVPALWSSGLSGKEIPTVETRENGLHIAVGEKTFVYERAGLRRATA